MTTRRAVRRLTKAPTPKLEPIDVRMEKARHLPLSGPGIVVSVPLGLLPEWLALNHLEPMNRGEVRDLVQATGKPKLQVLYAKRVKVSDEHSW